MVLFVLGVRSSALCRGPAEILHRVQSWQDQPLYFHGQVSDAQHLIDVGTFYIHGTIGQPVCAGS